MALINRYTLSEEATAVPIGNVDALYDSLTVITP